MASIRQGYLDDYSQQNQNVGIGTSIPKEKLEIHGGVTSKDLNVTGIATLTSASGFIKRNLEYSENVDLDAGNSATLSDEIIVGAGLTMTIGTGATAGQGNIDSLKVYSMFQPPTGGTNQRPVGKPGSLFYNTDFKTVEFFDGNSWRQVDNTISSGRAVLFRGADQGMESFNIMTLGNTSIFGYMGVAHQIASGFGSRTRGIIGGGYKAPGTGQEKIEYITLAAGGDSIEFGDLATSHFRNSGGCSSSTRGLFFAGGHPSYYNTIEYVEMNTLGNALDFGDQVDSVAWRRCFSSTTRGFSKGGFPFANSIGINVVTIASKGDAVEFGKLSHNMHGGDGCSNSVRGIFAGGYAPGGQRELKTIQYVTLASDGDAVNFGDLIDGSDSPSAVANQVRAVLSGGYVSPTNINTMQYITIATTGNAIQFGDLSMGIDGRACGTSDSHGGLGGF